MDSYVAERVPDDFGYLLRVCNLGDTNDYCKMPPVIFYATIDKDVFVEDVVISAEIGDGSEAEYSPKKVKMFFWEGGFPEDYCRDECVEDRSPLFCSSDFTKVLKNECGNFDTNDSCLESGTGTEVVEVCELGKICDDGECVARPVSLYNQLTCNAGSVEVDSGCVSDYDDECDAYDWGKKTGSCKITKEKYKCYNYVYVESECSTNPVCPSGTPVSSIPCTPPCVPVWSPLPSKVCAGVSFPQTNTCNSATQQAVGTKNCVASLSASYVLGSTQVTDGYTYYYFTSTISEKNGVGVTINSRQKCYQSIGCDSMKYNIATDYGTNYIAPNGQISDPANYWFTLYSPDRMTETFWGIDDNGNPVSVSYTSG